MSARCFVNGQKRGGLLNSLNRSKVNPIRNEGTEAKKIETTNGDMSPNSFRPWRTIPRIIARLIRPIASSTFPVLVNGVGLATCSLNWNSYQMTFLFIINTCSSNLLGYNFESFSN